MLPVVALVGQPNVGKSTLFNVLTRSRDALVVDLPGVTRDRQYGEAWHGDQKYMVIDTGGLSGETDGIMAPMADQVQQAIEEADVVVFVVDGRQGATAGDQRIAADLRRLKKPCVLVVNKTDGIDENIALGDFFQLGLGNPFAIAASHRRGVRQLVDLLFENWLNKVGQEDLSEQTPENSTKVALIGRPNVGKSTLANRLLGEDRVVVFDMPGTTRDSIYLSMERRGQAYTLIDTAGVRRRNRVKEVVEKFSVIKALQAIEDAHVAIVVIDGSEGLTEQDLHIIQFAHDAGRCLILAVNKWDGLAQDQKDHVQSELERRLPYLLDFIDVLFISALHGTNVGHLFTSIDRAYKCAGMSLGTSELTRVLEQALIDHQPPLVKGRRVKLRYAHCGGHFPPVIVVHGKQTESLPDSYRRYLSQYFRKAFNLVGTPVKVEFKTDSNPYAERREKRLTPRQRYTKQKRGS